MKHPLRTVAGIAIAGSVACAPPKNTRALNKEEQAHLDQVLEEGREILIPQLEVIAKDAGIGFSVETTDAPNNAAGFIENIERCSAVLDRMNAMGNIRMSTDPSEWDDIAKAGYHDRFRNRGTDSKLENDYIVYTDEPWYFTGFGFDMWLHEGCHRLDGHDLEVFADHEKELPAKLKVYKLAMKHHDLAYAASTLVSDYVRFEETWNYQVSNGEGTVDSYEAEESVLWQVEQGLANRLYLFTYSTPEELAEYYIQRELDDAHDGSSSMRDNIMAHLDVPASTFVDAFALGYDIEAWHEELLNELWEQIERAQEIGRERGQNVDVVDKMHELYPETDESRRERTSESARQQVKLR